MIIKRLGSIVLITFLLVIITGCKERNNKDLDSELLRVDIDSFNYSYFDEYPSINFNDILLNVGKGLQVIKTKNENDSIISFNTNYADQDFTLPLHTDEEIAIYASEPVLTWYKHEVKGWLNEDFITLSCSIEARTNEEIYLLGDIKLEFIKEFGMLYAANTLFVPNRTYQIQDEIEFMQISEQYDEYEVDFSVLLGLSYAKNDHFFWGIKTEEEFIEEFNMFEYVAKDDGGLYELSEDCKIFYLTNSLKIMDGGWNPRYVQISEKELITRLQYNENSSTYGCGIKDGKIIFMSNLYMP